MTGETFDGLAIQGTDNIRIVLEKQPAVPAPAKGAYSPGKKHMKPITNVRDISNIAYGFMASQALFVALHLEIFELLSQETKSLPQLAQESGIPPNRLLTLLTACVSIGLITKEGDRYGNSPASETYLVRQAPAYYGDYLRFQVDRLIYPAYADLEMAMRGEPTKPLYRKVEEQPEVAEQFSLAQHSGSLGPAYVVAKQVDFSQWRTLLDVAGGSGAFSITFCRRNPQLRATVLDFPNVIEVAKRFVAEAKLEGRINYIGGDALETAWPPAQDAILMSYLLCGVAEKHIKELMASAYRALKPGGQFLIHDFMVADDRLGPPAASLWFLGLVVEPEAISFSPGELSQLLAEVGFSAIETHDVISGLTKLVMATK